MPDITMQSTHGEKLRSIRPAVILLPIGVPNPDTYFIPGPIADHICSARMLTMDPATIVLGTEWKWDDQPDKYYVIYLLVNTTPCRMGRLIRLPQEYDSFDDMEDAINML